MSYVTSFCAIWILSLTACRDFIAPHGAYRIDPPAFFYDQWHRMEQCSGRRGNMDRITWFAVPGNTLTVGNQVRSAWWVAPHTIYLAESELHQSAWGVESVVPPHEMLHDLLQVVEHTKAFYECGVMHSP